MYVATRATTRRRKNYFKIQRSRHHNLLRKTIEKIQRSLRNQVWVRESVTCGEVISTPQHPFVATEIATGRRTKRKRVFRKRFGVTTIVILENYGKP